MNKRVGSNSIGSDITALYLLNVFYHIQNFFHNILLTHAVINCDIDSILLILSWRFKFVEHFGQRIILRQGVAILGF